MVLGSRGRHGRRDELEPGPIGQVGSLPEELLRETIRVPAETSFRRATGDERIPGDVVADRRVGTPRPDHDAAEGVGEVEDVEAELPADPVEPPGDLRRGPPAEGPPGGTPAWR